MSSSPMSENIQEPSQPAITQKRIDECRIKYGEKVRLWEKLKSKGLDDASCADICAFSRATYYRYKQVLANLERGILPPSRARLRQNKPQWGEFERQLVINVRRENPTYGKNRIAAIIARDHGKTLSVSTVGRILKQLFDEDIIQKVPPGKRPGTRLDRQVRGGDH